jgi:hypothetical protein
MSQTREWDKVATGFIPFHKSLIVVTRLLALSGKAGAEFRIREEPRADQRRPLAGARGFFYGFFT